MRMEELLLKINRNEIEDGTILGGGDLFYKLIVINKTLYVINELTKNLVILDSKNIGHFIDKEYILYEYKK